MAYARYIGKSAFASGTGALTVAALTGTQAGDVIVLFAESANQTVSQPTGYQTLFSQPGTGTAGAAGGVRLTAFYRILADAADTSTTVADSGDHTTAIKILLRDTALVSGGPFTVSASATSASTSVVFPSLTTTLDESLIVLAAAVDTDAASTATVGAVTNANLTSITERHDESVIAGAGGGLVIVTAQQATAGVTGTSTATGSTSVTRHLATIGVSRVAAQTTTSTFNTVDGTAYFPISDALRITAGSGGTINATSSGTFQPDTLTNGGYSVNFKWYWRQLGTDAWTTSTAVAQTTSASVLAGVLDTVGEFTDNETITGLTNGVEYEVVLFAARAAATPANTISFSATATIALPAGAFTLTAEPGVYTYSGNNANVRFNRRIVADPGSYTYSGNNANVLFNRRLFADPGTYSYSGNNANIVFNRRLVADTGVYTYSGNDATLTYTTLGAYTLTAEPGVYTYSGNNANVLFNRVLIADPGTYSYSGNNANLVYARRLVADPGSYTYSGNNANIAFNRRLVADPGSYTYSGNNANVRYGRRLVAEAGTYSYSGNNANIVFNRRLVADTGVYTYSGNDATLTYTTIGAYTLTAEPGVYTYSGNNANVLYGRRLVADPGTYSYSGNAANIVFNRRLVADPGSYTYSGNNANVRYGRRLVADPGVYTYSGNNANVRYGRRIVADPGTYSYSGNNANVLYGRRLVADPGVYTYSGNDATLTYTTIVVYTLTAEPGVYTYSGNDANLLFSQILWKSDIITPETWNPATVGSTSWAPYSEAPAPWTASTPSSGTWTPYSTTPATWMED
jgi:lipopolysaccharide export system protein LptA